MFRVIARSKVRVDGMAVSVPDTFAQSLFDFGNRLLRRSFDEVCKAVLG